MKKYNLNFVENQFVNNYHCFITKITSLPETKEKIVTEFANSNDIEIDKSDYDKTLKLISMILEFDAMSKLFINKDKLLHTLGYLIGLEQKMTKETKLEKTLVWLVASAKLQEPDDVKERLIDLLSALIFEREVYTEEQYIAEVVYGKIKDTDNLCFADFLDELRIDNYFFSYLI